MLTPLKLSPIEVTFSEAPSDTIQLFRIGIFHHPTYGKFNITSQMLSDMKKNFDERVRGIDIAVDYKHDSDDVAAGWIKGLELADDGKAMFAKVDWTPEGVKVLSNKEFRYISPEFSTDYQDNETLKKFGPVLLGAGLTNRPVIKKMEPVIELSEIKQSKGDNMQGEKKFADMSPEEMMAMIEQLKAELAKAQGESKDMAAKYAEMEKAQKYAEEAKVKLEKESQFQKLLTEGKACAAQKDSWMSGDLVKFAELAEKPKLVTEGKVAPENEVTFNDADDEIHHLAEKYVASKIVPNLEAGYRRVLAERQDLKNKKYAN